MECPELAGAKFLEGSKLKKARQDVTTMVVHAAGLRSRGTGNGATRLKSNDKRSVAAAGGGGGGGGGGRRRIRHGHRSSGRGLGEGISGGGLPLQQGGFGVRMALRPTALPATEHSAAWVSAAVSSCDGSLSPSDDGQSSVHSSSSSW